MISIFNKNYIIEKIFINELKKVNGKCKNILDVGCNNKPYQCFFQSERYIGIDLPNTSKNAITYHNCIADIYCDARLLPFSSESFNKILCFKMIEDIPNTGALLQEFNRVLSINGELFIDASQSWRLNDEPHDYYRFTKYGLIYLLNKNGFVVKKIVPLGGTWTNIGVRLIFFINEHIGNRFKISTIIRIFLNPFLNILFYIMFIIMPMHTDPHSWFVVAVKR